MATQTRANAQLSGKHHTLNCYSENAAGSMTVLQSFDTSSSLRRISWNGTCANVSGSHQVITVGGSDGVSENLHSTSTNELESGTILLVYDLRGVGSCTECAFTMGNYMSWSGTPETVITGLNRSKFTTVACVFPVTIESAHSFCSGNLPPGLSLSQRSGGVHLRNC